nr:hypothetical protein [uncultured Allomuricauda sp.]
MQIKDIIVTVREALIVLLFVLLLTTPSWIKNRLETAGFQKIDMGFAEWESRIEASKKEVEDVKSTTEAAQLRLNQVANRLESLATSPSYSNPAVIKRQVSELKMEVDASTINLKRSNEELEKSLENHKILLREVQTRQH